MLPQPDFPKPLAPAGQALRILLLEDDAIGVEIVGAYVQRIEFARTHFHHAGTLAEALALLARVDVDLVISDLHLPDSSGAATVDALVRVVGCPVIAITSALDPGLREATLACGAYEFLHKSDLTEATLTRLVRLAAMQARTFRSLRESEARFRSLSALTSDWFWETDAEHRFVSMPTRVDVVTRLGREAYVGRPRWEIPGLSPVGTTWAEHRALLDRHESFRDLQLCQVRADGSRVYLQISGEPTYAPEGTFTGYRGTAKDVSERSGAEAALRESEARFRQTFELAGSGMAHVGLDGRFLRVNRSLCRILGYPEHQLVGRSVKEISHPQDRDATDAARQGLRSGEVGSIRTQKRYRRPDGSTVWVDLTVALARSADGKPLYEIAVLEDITDRRNAEAALRESEVRFRTLTELTSDWYWEQDAELRFVSTGGASDARGGITPQAHVGLRRWELPRTEIVDQSWDEHRRVLHARRPFADLLLRRTSESGEVHYVSVAGQPMFDARGAFLGYRGVAKDVTNRIAAELELRRFRAALDAAGDMVFLVDPRNSTYLDFNETACRTLGYAREELLGMDTERVRLDRTRAQLLEDYRALAATPGASETGIGTYRRKDGSTFPVEVTRRLLSTRGGTVMVATARDLTERLRAEQAQAARHRYQERIARFGQAALAKRDASELVSEAAQTLLEALRADGVAYLEPEPASSAVVLRAFAGAAHGAEETRVINCAEGDPVARVLRSGERLLAEGDGLALPWAPRACSAVLVPVRGERGVRGVLCAFFDARERFAGDDSVGLIEAAASLLSTGLQRIDSEGRLAYLAQFDQITGLPNRTLLADRFSQMIVQAGRRGAPLAVLFVDLDEFKMVNDTLGHAGGDALLKEVGARLQATVRTGDTVARISGDEFAVVLADLARPEDAALVAQKIIERLAEAIEVHGKEVFVTASVGIAAFPADGTDAESLIRAADAAMYRAKQSGRNAYQFFTAEINQRSRARAQMGAELRRALEREEFALVYQPKFRLAERRPSGAEALLRWKHPERGVVSPAEFIPVLEETGLIVPVGEWVIGRACQDLKTWRAAGLDVGAVSVNLSARQFRLQDLDARVKALVDAAGLSAGLIELEITESQLMADPDHAIRVMRALCEVGMRIAIDDFGTGYSSLAYLRRFPVSSLKIDRSFVKDMSTNPSDATIVRTIIEMAHSLGFSVVAEGVETEEQAALLRLLRCEYAQGYLFARPMPAEELARLPGVTSVTARA